MYLFHSPIYIRVLFCLLIIFSLAIHSQAQDSKASVMLGTQFPLQYTAGFNYQFNQKFSGTAQGGLLTKPYDKYLLSCMEISGLDKNLSRIIDESFEIGIMAGIGVNYHFNKYYVGIYGLGIQMRGKGPLLEMANIYYKGKLPEVDSVWFSLAEGLQMNWRSLLINAGILAGRKFILPNSKFEIRTEIGLTKVLGSESTYTVGYAFLDETPLAQDLYHRLNKSFKESYWKYGYLPSINVYLVYKL